MRTVSHAFHLGNPLGIPLTARRGIAGVCRQSPQELRFGHGFGDILNDGVEISWGHLADSVRCREMDWMEIVKDVGLCTFKG